MAVLSDIRIDTVAPLPARASRGYWGSVLRRLMRDPVAMVAAGVILTIVLAAAFAPFVAPGDPYKGAMLRRLKPIGDATYWLGSHELGRGMLTRLIYGGGGPPVFGVAAGAPGLPVRSA